MLRSLLGAIALLALIPACRAPVLAVAYTDAPPTGPLPFTYADTADNVYLRTLRQRHRLDSVVAGATTDLQRAIAVTHWAHTRWEHSGWNEPQAYNALAILDEVAAGERFRCVEYGIVIREALQSLGLQARVVGLQTADVEKRRWGAGHVVAEVYLREHATWAFVDGQADAVPLLNDAPLSAVNFGLALRQNRNAVSLVNAGGPVTGKTRAEYLDWVAPYLHHFNTTFDARPRPTRDSVPVELNGKRMLYLVPEDAELPTVFQRKSPINAIYTYSRAAFYPTPE